MWTLPRIVAALYKGTKRVCVKTPSDALTKRMATLHLTIGAKRPKAKQHKPVVVFRGKGLRISAAEKAAYDPRVRVLFQSKAWVDRPIAVKIAEWMVEDEMEVLTHSHSFTLTHSLSLTLTPSLTLTHSLSITHSLTHSHFHSLTHSLTRG